MCAFCHYFFSHESQTIGLLITNKKSRAFDPILILLERTPLAAPFGSACCRGGDLGLFCSQAKQSPRLDSLTQAKLLACSPLIKRPVFTSAFCILTFDFKFRREPLSQRPSGALAAGVAISGCFATRQNRALKSILSRKASSCLAHLQKKGQVVRPGFCFGGGENRTLVLSKLPTNVYMLSAFIFTSALLKGTTRRANASLLVSKHPAKRDELRSFTPGLMTILPALLVRHWGIERSRLLGLKQPLIQHFRVYQFFFTGFLRRPTDILRMPLILCFQVETFTPPLEW